MLEIKGRINTAICYANVIEDEAIEQIRRMCDYEFTEGSRIRIMPDVHAGKGCTIGTTMTVVDKAVPNIVGVDIGCGMYTVNLGKDAVDFEKLDEAAHYIPSGINVWEGRQERFDLQELRCYRSLKDAKRLERSLGTLGGGNHFIEIDEAADGEEILQFRLHEKDRPERTGSIRRSGDSCIFAEEGEAELPVSDEEAFAYLQHFLVYAHSRCMKRALEETQTAAAE